MEGQTMEAGKRGRLRIYCDGACKPFNPSGVATYAFVVYQGEGQKKTLIYEESGVVAQGYGATNNLAEFAAVRAALRWVLKEGWVNSKITIFSDSQLVVNIMNQKWKPRSNIVGYYPAYLEAEELLAQVRAAGNNVFFHWVSRDYNTHADLLATSLAYKTYLESNGKNARQFKLKYPTTYCVCGKQLEVDEEVIGIPLRNDWKILCIQHICDVNCIYQDGKKQEKWENLEEDENDGNENRTEREGEM